VACNKQRCALIVSAAIGYHHLAETTVPVGSKYGKPIYNAIVAG